MLTLSSVTLPVFSAVIVYVITSPAETGLLNALVSAVFVTSIAAEGESVVDVPVPFPVPLVVLPLVELSTDTDVSLGSSAVTVARLLKPPASMSD